MLDSHAQEQKCVQVLIGGQHLWRGPPRKIDLTARQTGAYKLVDLRESGMREWWGNLLKFSHHFWSVQCHRCIVFQAHTQSSRYRLTDRRYTLFYWIDWISLIQIPEIQIFLQYRIQWHQILFVQCVFVCPMIKPNESNRFSFERVWFHWSDTYVPYFSKWNWFLFSVLYYIPWHVEARNQWTRGPRGISLPLYLDVEEQLCRARCSPTRARVDHRRHSHTSRHTEHPRCTTEASWFHHKNRKVSTTEEIATSLDAATTRNGTPPQNSAIHGLKSATTRATQNSTPPWSTAMTQKADSTFNRYIQHLKPNVSCESKLIECLLFFCICCFAQCCFIFLPSQKNSFAGGEIYGGNNGNRFT